MTNQELEVKTSNGLFFKLLERISIQLISLVISIILARLLLPEDYGIIAIATIFIEIMNVFISHGLGSSIIHKNDIDETDLSTCFWGSLLISAALYVILFLCSPLIAEYYESNLLTDLLRVLGTRILFSSVNSIQVSVLSKRFMYRQLLIVTLISVLISGATGIIMAYFNFGVWALVVQNLSSSFITTLLCFYLLKWLPKSIFSFERLKLHISYSWKIFFAGIVDSLYAEARELIIAKYYSTSDLAYYNKGAQFPKLIANSINQSVVAVIFPSLSSVQDDNDKIKESLRTTMGLITFFLFPLLFGLAIVSEDMVIVLLTEKWLDCVPFLQILCIAYLITPLQSTIKQALKAINKTSIFLGINIAEKIIGLILLVIAAFHSVLAICWSFVLYHVFGLAMYMVACSKLVGFSLLSQIKSIFPNLCITILMSVLVMAVGCFSLPTIASLIIKILVGIISYILLSLITKNETFKKLLSFLNFKKPTNKHN